MTDAVHRSSGDGQFTDNRMIMVIRHAEKPMHPSGSPHGVNPDGREDPHSLTVTGWIRAGALIPQHLGEVDPLPPDYWPPGRFDVIWTFTHDGGRWRFTQVPQLLLPGDLPYPICACLTTA